MAETLGTLCDKLTIVKLKQWHSDNEEKLKSLENQEKQLISEINEFIASAISGQIPIEKLSFASNKVFKLEGNQVEEISGKIGEVFAQLAQVNTNLWHEQEKVYDFENVPADDKNNVVKKLAHLNLQRNKCIDQIDKQLQNLIKQHKS